MATIHFNQTMALTPEQYVAGLTDFSPGRAKVFSKSADDYLKVHSVGHDEADVTEGSGGVWERLHYDWSDPDRVVLKTTDSNVWGGESGYTYLVSWVNAPAPALVATRLLESVLAHEVPPRYARLLSNGTHWGFGLANGAGYGLLLGSRRRPKVWFGLSFGAAVWASGYVVLPVLGVYQPIWKYDWETLRKDLSAHLVFGTATAAAFCVLAGAEVVK